MAEVRCAATTSKRFSLAVRCSNVAHCAQQRKVFIAACLDEFELLSESSTERQAVKR